MAWVLVCTALEADPRDRKSGHFPVNTASLERGFEGTCTLLSGLEIEVQDG